MPMSAADNLAGDAGADLLEISSNTASAEDQDDITKAALNNINMFGDLSWMTNQVNAAAPNEQQVKDVSDWVSYPRDRFHLATLCLSA